MEPTISIIRTAIIKLTTIGASGKKKLWQELSLCSLVCQMLHSSLRSATHLLETLEIVTWKSSLQKDVSRTVRATENWCVMYHQKTRFQTTNINDSITSQLITQQMHQPSKITTVKNKYQNSSNQPVTRVTIVMWVSVSSRATISTYVRSYELNTFFTSKFYY